MSSAGAPGGEPELVVACIKAADLRHTVDSSHRERGARLHQMSWGTLHDAYQARSACQRWNSASMSSAGAPGEESELLAPKRPICAILSTPRTMNVVQDFMK